MREIVFAQAKNQFVRMAAEVEVFCFVRVGIKSGFQAFGAASFHQIGKFDEKFLEVRASLLVLLA
jgi:hypothetical protein